MSVESLSKLCWLCYGVGHSASGKEEEPALESKQEISNALQEEYK